jgi:oxygen-independent coproporphyrinogen-3 oxidase
MKVYLSALLEEIKSSYKQEKIMTLYFGGGTPSLVPVKKIEEIIACFNLFSSAEITLEINPDDVSLEYLKNLKKAGINRISLGSQTFNDNILALIGRRHSSEQIKTAVKLAKVVGFDNISLDLIYGLPNQTIEVLETDLKTITSLGIQHISTYGLKIEDESFWGQNSPQNLPNDDEQADMYLMINEFLGEKGYNRYEISNFALKGFESKHNLNYWNNEEYYGFGISAHGYIDAIRYSNYTSFDKYLNNFSKKENEHIVTFIEKIEEEIFLGFRKEAGINVIEFQEKFGIDFEEKYKNILKKYLPKYLARTEGGYKLTLDGVLLSNEILTDFI